MTASGSLTPREAQLLDELRALQDLAEKVSAKLGQNEKDLGSRQTEIDTLRRQMIELKEENQHLREVLQTWRQRLDSVLTQLKTIN